MDQNKLRQLRVLFGEYVKLDPRREGECIFANTEDDDVDVDMWEEDTYLAGLVSSFLSGKELSVEKIVLDRSIDRRLNESLQRIEGTRKEGVRRYLEYRRKMRELAESLSTASGVPLR